MDKLEFLKEYTKLKNLGGEIGFGKILDGKKSIIFIDGSESTHIEYMGNKIIDGKMYRLSKGTCGGSCEIGIPNKTCVENGVYSKNKCAIYFHRELDLDNFNYQLSFEEFKKLSKLF